MEVKSSEMPPFSNVGTSVDQDWAQDAVRLILDQRFYDQRSSVEIFGAAGEIGVDDGNCLPVEQGQRAVRCAAWFGG